MLSVQHEPEKFFSKIGVPNSVKENRTLFVTETRDYCVGSGLSKRSCFVVGKDLYRQSIGFRRTIEITCLDEPELRGVGLGRDGGAFEHAHLPERARLRTKPATTGDVIGQNLSFDAGSLAVVEQGLQLRPSV